MLGTAKQNCFFTLKDVAPDTGFNTSIVNILRWSPNGRTLAVPGLRNDVLMYDRCTGEKLFPLRGDHLEAICWARRGVTTLILGLRESQCVQVVIPTYSNAPQ